MEVVRMERKTISGDVPDSVPKDFIGTTRYRDTLWGQITNIHCVCDSFQTPEANSSKDDIIINHGRAADPSIGDHFGATLRTFDPTERHNYYRHEFCSIDKHSPAKKMKIKNLDELVLVNDLFVPQMSHTKVLQLFSNLPVDGTTPLSLVATRKRRRHRRWRWIETKAVLAPDDKRITPDHKRGTDVKSARFRHSDKRAKYNTTEQKLQIEGLTEYVSITPNEGVSARANDEVDVSSTTIWKMDKILYENRHYQHWTSLYRCENNGRRWYINIGDNEINVSNKKQWMNVIEIGPDCRFSHDGHYLAYNKQSKDFESRAKIFLDEHKDIYVYRFSAYTIPTDNSREHSFDYPDGACVLTSAMANSIERAQSTSTLSSSKTYSSSSSSSNINHSCGDKIEGLPSIFYISAADGNKAMLDFSHLFDGVIGGK